MEKSESVAAKTEVKQPANSTLKDENHILFRFYGETFTKTTIIYLGILLGITLFINIPYFFKDVSPAFSGADAYEGIAYLLGFIGISKSFFYGLMVILAILAAPVSYFIFARRLVLKHELTAFLATLFFIVPNPFFHSVPIFVNALANGDGAHMILYAVLPMFLLSVQNFIRTGSPTRAILCAIGTTTIMIFAPFAGLNIVIFYVILSIAEGFMGDFRIKMLRCLYLLGSSLILSLLWYSPYLMSRIIVIDHIKYVINRFLTIIPFVIPIIPVAGAGAYLLFNGHERLKPIFVSISLFILYITLYITSTNLNISGIFTAQRYLPEVAFSASLFFAITFVLIYELILRNVFPKLQAKTIERIPLFIKIGGTILVLMFSLKGFIDVTGYAGQPIQTDTYSIGVGEIKKTIDFTDLTAIIVGLLSAVTLVVLVYYLTKYPSFKRKHSSSFNKSL